MKKSIIVLVVAVLGIAGLSSCQKDKKGEHPVTADMNVTLKQNETYTFTLPENKTQNPYHVTSQAKHYSTSLVTSGCFVGGERYTYTPSLNYWGTDNVSIANTKIEKCGGSCGHGGCGEQAKAFNINFTIVSSSSNTERTAVVSAVSGTSK